MGDYPILISQYGVIWPHIDFHTPYCLEQNGDIYPILNSQYGVWKSIWGITPYCSRSPTPYWQKGNIWYIGILPHIATSRPHIDVTICFHNAPLPEQYGALDPILSTQILNEICSPAIWGIGPHIEHADTQRNFSSPYWFQHSTQILLNEISVPHIDSSIPILTNPILTMVIWGNSPYYIPIFASIRGEVKSIWGILVSCVPRHFYAYGASAEHPAKLDVKSSWPHHHITPSRVCCVWPKSSLDGDRSLRWLFCTT